MLRGGRVRGYEMAMGHGLSPERQMRLLSQVHAAFLEGRRPPAQPRRVIRDSWTRVRRSGLNPVRGGVPVDGGDMTRARESDPAQHGGAALLAVSKVLSAQLDPLLSDGDLLLVRRGELNVVANLGDEPGRLPVALDAEVLAGFGEVRLDDAEVLLGPGSVGLLLAPPPTGVIPVIADA